MVNFIGRSGHNLLFEKNGLAVVVDSRVSVVSTYGALSSLEKTSSWVAGEVSEADFSIAETAFDSLTQEPSLETTGRMYTIPRGVQVTAKKASEEAANENISPIAKKIGAMLASGGQIDFGQLVNISNQQSRLEEGSLASRLYGGEATVKWAGAIVSREAVTASADYPEIDLKTLEDNPESGPYMVARLHTDGSGIDRLYRVDVDGTVYVWHDDVWDDLGHSDWDIWRIDSFLDDDIFADYTHVTIDPESAVYIAANLKYGPVFVEDINLKEYRLITEAADELDWELLDSTLTAAGGTPGDGIYTPDERSENAAKQVRDKTGKFAKQGGRVMVNGVPGATGTISRVNPADGTVEISMDSGGSQVVKANTVESIGQYTATIPGKPVEIPRVDFSGIIGEPRTPINRVKGQIPGTLPAMTPGDLHSIIDNFPAWVKSQREQFKGLGGPNAVGVQAKNSLNPGKEGAALMRETGRTLTTDAYDHPLLNRWLNKKNSGGYYENRLWYRPITAAGETAQEMTPEQSDVQPVYMAVVSPDDPRAVFKLISLVPASSESTAPMVYSREDGQWVKDEQTLLDLRSATPPPVVPLDSDNLNDVLVQVDSAQTETTDAMTREDEEALAAPLPAEENLPPGAPAVESVVVASAIDDVDFNLMVLWGPRKELMEKALTAAGGLDRNRGGAEKLRRYWTKGPGGAKIVWGTPGDWTRCVRYLGKYLGPRAKGYCALRHKEMNGMWPGDRDNRQVFTSNTAGTLYSTELVESSDRVLQASVLRARAQASRERVLTASAGGSSAFLDIHSDSSAAIEALTASGYSEREVGAAFYMPIALPEGIESGDGRLIEPGVAEIRDLPIPLLWQFKTAAGHDGSVVVGRIDKLRRVPGGIGAGFGYFDVGPWGREAERMVRNGMLRFVSADMDKFGAVKEKSENTYDEASEKDEIIQSDKVRVKKTRIMAVTIVAKPAFQEATIRIVPEVEPQMEETVYPDGLFMEEPDPIDAPALVAAGYIAEAIPVTPPRAWFENPRLEKPTPLTVTDDGRVFGHIAAWTSGHINPRLGGINPPRSKSNYAYFHSGVLRTEEGDDVTVGQITLTGGHAGLEASAEQAVKHYDDTGSALADVHAGEDEFGIWVAGSLRPGATPEQVRAFRAAAPSGDWRPIRGALELVAVCQVNVPGFPIARAFVASGEMTALVAAGAMPLAKMKSDPISELSARLEAVEQVAQYELSARAASIMERMAPTLDKKNKELQARAEAITAAMENFGYVSKKVREKAAEKGHALPDGSYPISSVSDLKNAIRAYGRANESDRAKVRRHIMKRARVLGREDLIPDKWKTAKSSAMTASAEAMRARIAEFSAALSEEERRQQEMEDAEPDVSRSVSDEEQRPKYQPGRDQPRDYRGRFRDVLARLKEDLGVSGNQGVVEKIQETDAKIQTGDYVSAVKGALHLRDVLDRLDEGALDATALSNVRESAKNLGTIIANMPLPFTNQAAKIRYSDLPPVMQDLVEEFIERVERKIGPEDAAVATKAIKDFKSGSDLFSQGDISSELSKLLRLLT